MAFSASAAPELTNADLSAAQQRPTAAELHEALEVITRMKSEGILARTASAKPNVVACAIALRRGERFSDDREALRRFGAHPETKVRELCVEGKLAAFAPAGMATAGPALPTYLLERGEPPPSVPSYVGPEQLEALRASCLRLVPSSLEGAEREEAELDELGDIDLKLKAMARSEREYAAWAAAHGAQRDKQHASLVASEPWYYWALSHRPASPVDVKWQLRRRESLEDDAMQTLGKNQLGFDEPLLLYRAFWPFTGDDFEATNHFATRGGDREWLRAERAKLDAQVAADGKLPRQPLRARDSPQFDAPPETPEGDSHSVLPPTASDGIRSAAAFGVEASHQLEQCVAERERREAENCSNGYEQMCDRTYEEDSRRSVYYGRPAGELPPDAVAPSVADVGPISNRDARERQVQLERLHELLADRAYAATIPPPRRDDPKYDHPLGHPLGACAFHKDRSLCYERITGDSLDELSLSEQRALSDAIARRFRQYNDGRPQRSCAAAALSAIAEEMEDRADEQQCEEERAAEEASFYDPGSFCW